jgi:hypothetical protein
LSKISLKGNTSGTGTFTIEAPASNSNRTFNLPDEAGTLVTSATAIPQSQIASALNASGSAPIYACRAWVNFNGTGTVAIRASGNVSSITDNGTGRYTINFTTAMPDANYCTTGASQGEATSSADFLLDGTPTTTSVPVRSITSTQEFADNPIMNAAIFR